MLLLEGSGVELGLGLPPPPLVLPVGLIELPRDVVQPFLQLHEAILRHLTLVYAVQQSLLLLYERGQSFVRHQL